MNTNTLNAFIFKILTVYLIYNNRLHNNNDLCFKTILELSLISKSTFKSIQNLIISHPLNKQLFILPKITQFFKYILYNNHDDTSYKYKLIQYKDINEIRFFNITDEIFEKGQLYSVINSGSGNNDKLSYTELLEKRKKEKENNNQDQDIYEDNGNDIDETEYFMEIKEKVENLYFQLSRIKSILNFKCPLLKQLVIVGPMESIEMIPFDFTFGGFYQVKKLQIHFRRENSPISSFTESIASYTIEQEDFDFSFNFLKMYKPIKFAISSIEYGDICFLQLSNGTFDNILKNGADSIKSFSSSSYPVTPYEIEKMISSSSPVIKSLAIEVDLIHGALVNSNFTTTNTTLRKLIISKGGKAKRESIDSIFELLKLNKSLTSLGLDYYSITDHNLLSPLKEIKNITTFYTNSCGLKAALNHCNENHNITELHYVKDNHQLKDDKEFSDKQIFIDFLKFNISSLNTIILKSYYHSSMELKELLDHQFADGHIKNYPNIIISQKYFLKK